MKKIPLSKGKFALVDDVDFESVSKFKWHLKINSRGRGLYVWGSKTSMHGFILNTPDGMFVDHINMNGLDNRRSNLRIVTKSQNEMNRGVQKNNRTGIKGVHLCSSSKSYRARISINKVQYILGYFKTKEHASIYYQIACLFLHGEFARLK